MHAPNKTNRVSIYDVTCFFKHDFWVCRAWLSLVKNTTLSPRANDLFWHIYMVSFSVSAPNILIKTYFRIFGKCDSERNTTFSDWERLICL